MTYDLKRLASRLGAIAKRLRQQAEAMSKDADELQAITALLNGPMNEQERSNAKQMKSMSGVVETAARTLKPRKAKANNLETQSASSQSKLRKTTPQ